MAACLLSMAGSRGGARPLAAGTGALPPEGRAVLTALRFHGSPDKHPAQIQNRCTKAYRESLLSLSGPLSPPNFHSDLSFNFSLPIKALAGRSSERLYLLPPTLQMKAPSTSYLACNHFPDKGGGEMMAGGQPGSDSFSWSRRS